MSLNSEEIKALSVLATRLRILSIESTNASKSGHPTSCSSVADIVATLFFRIMKIDVKNPKNPNSDRFVLSKGHAAPILYSVWTLLGYLKENDIMNLRKIDSDLEGHPTPRLGFVDVATGSLGQGLGVSCGMAYVGKYVDEKNYRVFCIIGDGESAEGSIWEALAFASYYKLNNLVAIFDINRLGQSQSTMYEHDLEVYRKKIDAFGFDTVVIDGHNLEEIYGALKKSSDKPIAIVAKTFKGFDFPNVSDKHGFHGTSLNSIAGDVNETILKHLRSKVEAGGDVNIKINPLPLTDTSLEDRMKIKVNVKLSVSPSYKIGESIATRLAYGNGLAKLCENNSRVFAFDGDTKNSTFSIKALERFPKQFVECFIAEQNMVSVAVGAATRNRCICFVSTFAAFFSRAFDQIRMAAISFSNVNFVGSHSGISIGEDGPSQMGLEDLAMFRTISSAIVFYPSDAVSTERAIELAANYEHMCYVRTTRANTPVIYNSEEVFEIGRAKVVQKSESDKVTIVAAGITLDETVKAAKIISNDGISVCIIDPFTIKPLDRDTILNAAKRTGGRVLVVEDHYYEGGIGDAVCSALACVKDITVKHLAVKNLPRSGKPNELLKMFGIDADSIVSAIKSMI